jgi:16S rRNA (guanine527-N7)-methyltransferase
LFQEAVWASAFYPDNEKSHLDIGSGGGFPAIPLRILRPKMRLELVESRSKRCTFLETVVNQLDISEAAIHNMRLNDFLDGPGKNTKWDFISWKAIKLTGSDLERLRTHAHAETQFWIFHAKELAVQELAEFLKHFKFLRAETFPCKKDWYLSIYRTK